GERGDAATPATRTAGIGNDSVGPSPLALDVLHTINASTQAKEARATPGRAGDGARDGGEASVGGLSPHVTARNNSDRVSLALVFTHEHCAGLEAPWAVRSRRGAPFQAVQELCGIRIKPTEGLLLDVPADEPRQEVLGEGRGRGRPQDGAPQGA